MVRAVERLCLNEADSAGDEGRGSARRRALNPSNPLQRSAIALPLSLAYSPHLASLALETRVRLLGEIARGFGKIGYERKRGFVLRELAGVLGEGVGRRGGAEVVTTSKSTTTIREEDEDGGTSKRASLDAGRKALPRSPAPPSTVRTTSTDQTGNESIITILETVCSAFGIDILPRVSSLTARKEERRKSVLQGPAAEEVDDTALRFGWPSLQMGVLRDAIAVAEALPGQPLSALLSRLLLTTPPSIDYQSAIRLTVSALRSLSSTMPPSEQLELSQNIPRIFAAATRRGAAFELEYWGPKELVMSMEIAP